MVILYADDDEDDREIFSEILSKIDPEIKLIEAEDGFQAISILDKNESPDIIFLDINMPVLNGYETLAEIRKDARFTDTRVIMFSTALYQQSFDKYLSLNANFLSKPNTVEDGVQALKTIFDQNHKSGLAHGESKSRQQ